MSISIPSGVFTTYREFADAMISDFGINCTLYFETISTTETSVSPTKQKRRMSLDPVAPEFGRGSQSYETTTTTSTVKLRVYWSRRDWVKVGNFDIPDLSIQTIGYMTDLESLKKADKMSINNGENFEFELIGEPFPHGIKQDRYVICYWRRI